MSVRVAAPPRKAPAPTRTTRTGVAMAGICAALAALFAFVAVAPTRPVEVRTEHTPAAWSSR